MLDKNRILELRDLGLTTKEIADELKLSVNTVKSIIRRTNNDEPIVVEVPKHKEGTCLYCGSELNIGDSHREKKFCSDKCRMAYWNDHRSELKSTTLIDFTCKHCGKTFKAQRTSKRIYCGKVCMALAQRSSNGK